MEFEVTSEEFMDGFDAPELCAVVKIYCLQPGTDELAFKVKEKICIELFKHEFFNSVVSEYFFDEVERNWPEKIVDQPPLWNWKVFQETWSSKALTNNPRNLQVIQVDNVDDILSVVYEEQEKSFSPYCFGDNQTFEIRPDGSIFRLGEIKNGVVNIGDESSMLEAWMMDRENLRFKQGRSR